MTAPLFLLAAAFLGGLSVNAGFAAAWPGWLALSLVSVGGAGLAWRRGPRGAVLGGALALACLAGLLRWPGPAAADPSLAAALDTERVDVTGVVREDAHTLNQTQQVRLDMEALALGAEAMPASGTLLLTAPPSPRLRYGDRITGAATVRPPGGDAPLEARAAEAGIDGVGVLRDLRVLAHDQGNPLRAALAEARRALDRALARALDDPLAGLAQGMVTGRRAALDPDLRADLNASGLSHLVVISGSNVSLLAGVVLAGTAWIVGRRRAVWLALSVVAAYTLFVGADAPVLRAAIMAALFLAATAAGRRADAAPAVTFAAAVMAAASPRIVGDLSFQLSVFSTAAIAVLAPPLWEISARRLAPDPAQRGPGERILLTLAEVGVVTAVATAATLPLLALHFDRLPALAVPANLLVAPLFPLIFLGSLATALAGAATPALGDLLGGVVAWLPLSWFVAVARTVADLPGATIAIDDFGVGHALVLYAALIATAIAVRRRPAAPALSPAPARFRRQALDVPAAALAAGILLALNVVVWSGVTASAAADDLRVDVLDVGQGDALLIQPPGGGAVLIDGGPSGPRLLAQLAAALPPGTRRLDLVIATHPQADHIGGLFAALERYRVDTLLLAPANGTRPLGQLLADDAAARGVRVLTADAGDVLTVGPVRLDVLSPPEGAPPSAHINDAGLVLRLVYGRVAFLFTGDIQAPAELALGWGPADLSATVLKVAHHGSATSTTDLLLRRVHPAIAVIPVGAENAFGHPRPEVLARLSGLPVLRTDRHGAITFHSDGASVRYHTARAGS